MAKNPNEMPMDEAAPEGLDSFVTSLEAVPSQEEVQALPQTTVEPAVDASGAPVGLDEFIAPELKEAKYGTPAQQAVTALESAAAGATFGLSTGLERALGVSAEDIRARREVNPMTAGAGEIAGIVGSAFIPGVGAANLATKGGTVLAAKAGLGAAEAGMLSKVGADVVKGAFEAALFQGGSEISKAFMEDPSQTAETAISDIGLSAVLGGVFSGTISAALRKAGVATNQATSKFVSELDEPGMVAGDFKTLISNADDLTPAKKESILRDVFKLKDNVDEIDEAADFFGIQAPEGVRSASKTVQIAEDSLLSGRPTVASIQRQKLYNENYAKISNKINEILPDEAIKSKAQIGNEFKDTITKQLKEEIAPTESLYKQLKESHKIIPLAEDAIPAVNKALKEIPELRVAPGSAESKLAKRVMRELSALKTVDDIKVYKTALNNSLAATASPGERRIVGIIGGQLRDLEENSVEAFARQVMKKDPVQGQALASLIDVRKQANKQYSNFIKKVQTLSEQLGKGRIHGPDDVINFINERLTPEEVTSRLFAKNNSEFLAFFGKEFPDQMQAMKEYQKGLLRDAATKSGEFNIKNFITNVEKLQPEIRQALFSPEEQAIIKNASTYIKALPESFNPSGTSTVMAVRKDLSSPTTVAYANLQDKGIDQFIKMGAHLRGETPETAKAISLAKSTVNAYKKMLKVTKDVFNPDVRSPLTGIAGSQIARDKLDKKVTELQENPQKLLDIGNDNPMPEYANAFAQTSARAVQYLASLKPNTDPKSPLDGKRVVSNAEKARYARALDIANAPLSVVENLKSGNITAQDVIVMKTLYPKLYRQVSQQLVTQMTDAVAKGKEVPYKTKLGLSLFIGQPLDSTMTSQSIMSAQPKPAPYGQQADGSGGQQTAKRSMKALNKLPNMYKTPGQSRQQDNQND